MFIETKTMPRRKTVKDKIYEIVVIGSGNVATHYAHAFSNDYARVVQVFSRNLESAKVLAYQFNASYTNSLSLLKTNADIYIISVSDDALFDIALDIKLKDKICFHTSGTVPIDVLKPISKNYGVIYAPQTFIKHIAVDYSTLPFCIEASNTDTLDFLMNMAQQVSPTVYSISGEQRRYIHLAAVFANNFGNCINAMAQNIMETHDLPFSILHPLIAETAKKTTQGENLWKLQTGPAKRGDLKTLEKHRYLLANNAEYLKVYDMLTSIIAKNKDFNE